MATGTQTRKENSKSKAIATSASINGKDIVQQWLYGLNVPAAVKKRAFNDAMSFLSSKGMTSLDNLTKEQANVLKNVLGNFGVRAVEWKKYYPKEGSQSAPKPATSKAAEAQRQGLTFSDMLSDLGLTGKESANPEALKKVQDWLAARPSYSVGAKTNQYLEQLKSTPADTKTKPVDTEAQQPENTKTPKTAVTETQQSKSDNAQKSTTGKGKGKGYKFKNRKLYRSAVRAYKVGGTMFIGNDGKAELFDDYDVSKFTVSDMSQKVILNPNIVTALKQRF